MAISKKAAEIKARMKEAQEMETKVKKNEETMRNNGSIKTINDLRREFGIVKNGTVKKSIRESVCGNGEVVLNCRLMEILSHSENLLIKGLEHGEIGVGLTDIALQMYVFAENTPIFMPGAFPLHMLAELRIFRENLKKHNINPKEGIIKIFLKANDEGVIEDVSRYKVIQCAEFEDILEIVICFEQ